MAPNGLQYPGWHDQGPGTKAAPQDRCVRGVLFDLDGTLINTYDLYIEAYSRALEPYVGRRLSEAELIALRPVSEIGLIRSVVGEVRLASVHREFISIYRALHGGLFGGIYRGIPEMLAALRLQDLLLGIVTGKSQAAWQVTTAAIGLGPFDAVVTDDHVDQPKPNPDGICLALHQLRLKPENAIYVGDSTGDAKAARAAGVSFAAALWPKAREEVTSFVRAVGEYEPWRILQRPEELTDAIRVSKKPGDNYEKGGLR